MPCAHVCRADCPAMYPHIHRSHTPTHTLYKRHALCSCPADCGDMYPHCGQWMSEGWCNRCPSFMKHHCMRSCLLCPDADLMENTPGDGKHREAMIV